MIWAKIRPRGVLEAALWPTRGSGSVAKSVQTRFGSASGDHSTSALATRHPSSPIDSSKRVVDRGRSSFHTQKTMYPNSSVVITPPYVDAKMPFVKKNLSTTMGKWTAAISAQAPSHLSAGVGQSLAFAHDSAGRAEVRKAVRKRRVVPYCMPGHKFQPN